MSWITKLCLFVDIEYYSFYFYIFIVLRKSFFLYQVFTAYKAFSDALHSQFTEHDKALVIDLNALIIEHMLCKYSRVKKDVGTFKGKSRST